MMRASSSKVRPTSVPLAGHRLEQHARALTLKHHLAQGIDSELDAGTDPLTHMCAGMEIVELPGAAASMRCRSSQASERELAAPGSWLEQGLYV